MARREAPRVLAIVMAGCLALALAAAGCSRSEPPQAAPTPVPVSAVRPANRLDSAAAEKVVLAYLAATRADDATAAAALMTPYRRGEVRAAGWAATVAHWRSLRTKAVVHPGKYIADERSFAELYADRVGHPPYKLMVLNVSFTGRPGTPPSDTDFVVTRDTSSSPWLVDDFGGAPSAGN